MVGTTAGQPLAFSHGCLLSHALKHWISQFRRLFLRSWVWLSKYKTKAVEGGLWGRCHTSPGTLLPHKPCPTQGSRPGETTLRTRLDPNSPQQPHIISTPPLLPSPLCHLVCTSSAGTGRCWVPACAGVPCPPQREPWQAAYRPEVAPESEAPQENKICNI